MKALIISIIVVLLGIASIWGGVAVYSAMTNNPPTFSTIEIKRGEIVASITATGTLEPEETVDVGAQVTGIIDKFGDDLGHPGKTIDYCSQVKKGQLLAKIDDVTYNADYQTAVAAEKQAESNVKLAKANVMVAGAKFTEAKDDWNRAQKTGTSEALSQSDYDMYQTNFLVAQANKAVADATVDADQEAVVQAQQAEDKAKRNLEFCTIDSPVDGVVIDRRVNVGQTVVSSMSAQSLFLLAKDLTRMVIWASVNEADVGNIHPGQKATFTVDAFPGETFDGTVSRVRYNAQMTQNVVTYTVDVDVENPSLKLMPYMTANLQFLTEKHENALIVPNAALRWEPSPQDIAPGSNEHGNSAPGQGGMSSAVYPSPSSGPSTSQPARRTTRGTLWVQDGHFVKPIHVRVGVSDGTNSEIFGPDVKEGMSVVVNVQRSFHH